MNLMAYTGKYCIIGAGAAGITAAKNLLQFNIACDVIEREDDVGGNWYFGKPNGGVYASTHLISSSKRSGYTDYPMPDQPDHPRHDQVLAYLRDYARHGLINCARSRLGRSQICTVGYNMSLLSVTFWKSTIFPIVKRWRTC